MSLFTVALGRRSYDTQLSLRAPWLADGMGAGSKTGVPVTRETALTLAGWWRAVSLISRSMAKVGTILYRVSPEGKQRAVGDPRFYMLHRKWNSEMTAYVAKQLLAKDMLQEGESFAFVDREGSGLPVQIIPILAGDCRAVRVAGQLQYAVSTNGVTRPVSPSDILHFRDLGRDGISGYSRLQKARETVGMGIGARDYSAHFFTTGGGKKIVLETPLDMDEQQVQDFMKGWRAGTTGLDAIHKTALLTHGMKASVIGVSAKEAQLVEARVLENRDVAMYFDLPPSKLGDPNSKAYASLEQDNQTTLDEAFDPIMVNWEQEMEDKLLTEEEKRTHSMAIEFRRQQLVRADLNARSAAHAKSVGGLAWKTVEEVRLEEGYNARPSVGDLQQPGNIAPKDDPAADPEPEPDPTKRPNPLAEASSRMRAAAESVLAEARVRMVRRLATHARRRAKDPKAFDAWLESAEDEHLRVVESALAPGASCMASLGDTVSPRVEASALIRAVLGECNRVAETTTAAEFAAAIDAAMTQLESSYA